MKITALITALTICNILSFAQQSTIDIKKIQKNMVSIEKSLYACKFEVTNGEYQQFLDYLREHQRSHPLRSAQIDSTQWAAQLTFNEPFVTYYHSHDAYTSYPVVNISHTGAELYCVWLTDQYNADPGKKFGRVQFRLPTEDEWMLAATGGLEGAIYPWKGASTQNNKGTYFANFNTGQGDNMGVAGNLNENADITAPVESYYPNKFGLYNMGGNVAEMVTTEGKTKGGSWLDKEEALRIESDGQFDKPSPTVGFRYFMEVIEP